MKDLKHLIFFEHLLQQANNELITRAKDGGGVCVAFTCENIPEPLLNLGRSAAVCYRYARLDDSLLGHRSPHGHALYGKHQAHRG